MAPQLYCPECKSNIKVGTSRGEQFCLEHPEASLRPKRAGSNRKPGRKGTASYARARTLFANTVCGKRCFFASTDEMGERIRPEHECNSYRLEAHHLVPKSWIEGNYQDLPEDEFLDVIFNWRIGAPLCPAAHHLITVRSDCIYFEELAFEAVEFCEAIDVKYPDRPSMLGRLELESPTKGPLAPERSQP